MARELNKFIQPVPWKNRQKVVAFLAHTVELSSAVSGFDQRFGKFGCWLWFEFIGGGIKDRKLEAQ